MSTVSQRRKPSAVTELAKAIREAIADGSTTVVKLADKTGMSRMQIYRIMDGDNAPSLANAEKLAKELGLVISIERAH
jgi:DNA-binding phage protein